MSREEIIKNLIKEKYKSTREFSRESGIANSTLASMFKKGIGGTGIDTVTSVCHSLGITVDELNAEFEHEKSPDSQISEFKPEKVKLLNQIEQLNEIGCTIASAYIEGLLKNPDYVNDAAKEVTASREEA